MFLESWWGRSTGQNQDLQGVSSYPKSEGTPDPCQGWTSPFRGLVSLNLPGSTMIWGDFSPPAWNHLSFPQRKALALLPGPCFLLI